MKSSKTVSFKFTKAQQNEVAQEVREKFKKVSFTNKHGEQFNLYSDGVSVIMDGDEVRDMVADEHKIGGLINLFNPVFSIWNVDEIAKLGQALKDLAEACRDDKRA